MFTDSRFLTQSTTAPLLAKRVLELVSDRSKPHLLDLGCGSAALAISAALQCRDLTAVALDVSQPNIEAAQLAIGQSGVGERVTPMQADYVTWSGSRFDAVAADSVIHLIDAPDATLAARLANDLKPGGFLVASIPVDSIANHLRIALRRLWRVLPKSADDFALSIARRLFPNLPPEIVLDRIPYLRIIPFRLCGPRLQAEFERHGLQLCATEPMANPSVAKPTHALFVWRRHA